LVTCPTSALWNEPCKKLIYRCLLSRSQQTTQTKLCCAFQVVIIAVYSYFLLQLFSAQFIRAPLTEETAMGAVNRSCGCSKPDSTIDFFVPIFTIFQFLFLMGWLKVAMCVMNPFGDDDEDFQTSEILDYNLEISRRSASADEMMFPFDFKLPDMKTKPQPQAEADNLPEFLARMSIEMERTHRELLVEMSEPVGLTRVGISGGVNGGGGGGCCCWAMKVRTSPSSTAIVATWSPWTAVSRSLRSPMGESIDPNGRRSGGSVDPRTAVASAVAAQTRSATTGTMAMDAELLRSLPKTATPALQPLRLAASAGTGRARLSCD
ncbi:hypothetical protein BOX15_Mlig016098g2, partial [Macrostomum lignano]